MLDLDFGFLTIYVNLVSFLYLWGLHSMLELGFGFWEGFAIFAQVWVPHKNRWEGSSKFFHVETNIFAKRNISPNFSEPKFMFSGTCCPTLFRDTGLIPREFNLYLSCRIQCTWHFTADSSPPHPGWASLRNFGILSQDCQLDQFCQLSQRRTWELTPLAVHHGPLELLLNSWISNVSRIFDFHVRGVNRLAMQQIPIVLKVFRAEESTNLLWSLRFGCNYPWMDGGENMPLIWKTVITDRNHEAPSLAKLLKVPEGSWSP